MNAPSIPADAIRPARASDLPAINALIRRSVTALASGVYDSRQIEGALDHVVRADPQLVADGTHYVVERRGQVIASGAWSFRARLFGSTANLHTEEKLNPAFAPAVLRCFYVEPEHARRGLGRCLLRTCESAAARAGFVSAELVTLTPGLPFFRAGGYVVLDHWELTLPREVSLPVVWMHKTGIGE